MYYSEEYSCDICGNVTEWKCNKCFKKLCKSHKRIGDHNCISCEYCGKRGSTIHVKCNRILCSDNCYEHNKYCSDKK